jgi:hypothetical protein
MPASKRRKPKHTGPTRAKQAAWSPRTADSCPHAVVLTKSGPVDEHGDPIDPDTYRFADGTPWRDTWHYLPESEAAMAEGRYLCSFCGKEISEQEVAAHDWVPDARQALYGFTVPQHTGCALSFQAELG